MFHHGLKLFHTREFIPREICHFKECGKHTPLEVINTKSYVSDSKLFVKKKKSVVNKCISCVNRS